MATDTDTRGPQVAAVTYVFLIMSTIATVLRVYCRGRVIKAFAMDDWLAVAAQVGSGFCPGQLCSANARQFFFIVFCAYEITGFIYGTGQHNRNLSAEQLPKAMQVSTQ